MATKSSIAASRSQGSQKPPAAAAKPAVPVPAVKIQQSPPVPDPPAPSTPYELLTQVKNGIQSANLKVQRVREGFEAVKSDLSLLVKSEEAEAKKTVEERFMQATTRREAVVDTLFSHVKKAVFMADAQIDKYCFKRRGNYTQAECKKGVTSALEKMANDIWTSLMGAMDKPASFKLAEAVKAVNGLQAELEELSKGVEDSLGQMEEVLYEHFGEEDQEQPQGKAFTERQGEKTARGDVEDTGALTSRGRQPSPALRKNREEFTSELQAEGQRMLNSFQRFTASRKGTRTQSFGLRKEMDDILKDMVTAVESSYPRIGRTEDADTWRMKKEVLRIRQRVDHICRNMENTESSAAPQDTSVLSLPASAARGRGGDAIYSEDFDALSEVSDRSRARSQIVTSSWDPEELKQEFSKQMKESQRTVIGAIKEQHQSIANVTQVQSTLQLKQDLLNADVAEIRKKLNDLFPGTQSKSKLTDLSKSIAVLKAFAPDIRAMNDAEFMEKFTQQVSIERQEVESFMAVVRGEGYSFASLEEVGKEFSRLKESYVSLREDHDEFLLKMIRSQSEYELELDFHKSANSQLQSELQELRDSLQAEGSDQAPGKISSLLAEIERLKADLSAMEPIEVSEPKDLADSEAQTDEVPERVVERIVEKIVEKVVKVPEKVFVEKVVEKVVEKKVPEIVEKIVEVERIVEVVREKPKVTPTLVRIKGLGILAQPPKHFPVEPEYTVITQDFGAPLQSADPFTVEEEEEVVGVTDSQPQEMLVGSSVPEADEPEAVPEDPEPPQPSYLVTEEADPQEVVELRSQIHTRVDILKEITDEEQAIEAKMTEFQTGHDYEEMNKLSEMLSEIHQRYDETFGEIEGLQEKISQLTPQKRTRSSRPKYSLAPPRDTLVEDVRSLLNIQTQFEVLGTLTHDAMEWALVRLADTYVWVKPSIPRPDMSNEEMIAHCLEANYMIEPYPMLPKHLVLATGLMLDLLKEKLGS